ncbi:MAG: class I SAM-dependent methyltransferase [Ignavibacteriaceae bacterium]|nr:class I SAM-dependent methyltransferase [Ignavibacteriaceae bacterium]
MPDFRDQLYKNYVTKFKKYYISSDPDIIKSDWIKYKKKIIPLLLNYGKKAEILEIGCGPGYILEFLNNEGYCNLIGIDISEEQIEKAKSKGLNVRTENVFDYLKDNKNKYDIIIAFDFIEHFNKEELYNLVVKIYHSLKESGMVIIRTPNGEGIASQKIIYGDFTHLTILTPDSLFQLLKMVGFSEINFWETGPIAKNLTGFIRLILWKIIRLIYNFIRLVETGGVDKVLTQDFTCSAKK